jgi:antitoxin YefM
MTIQTTYSDARKRLATLLDEVVENREVVVIRRRGREDVAMIAADDLASMMETLHVLGDSTTTERLLTALARARAGGGRPLTTEELRREVGLDAPD